MTVIVSVSSSVTLTCYKMVGWRGLVRAGPLPMPCSRWQVLQEKFSEFANETGTAGRERLAAVNQMVDELIECGHTAAATMAEWKDGLNEAWAELLELMGTRAQLLAASRELHKFFSDARELQGQIEEKRRRLPRLTAPPEPRPSASSMQRTLRAFEHDLQLLVSQVGRPRPRGEVGGPGRRGQGVLGSKAGQNQAIEQMEIRQWSR